MSRLAEGRSPAVPKRRTGPLPAALLGVGLLVAALLVVTLLWAAGFGGGSEPAFYLGGIQVNEADLDHWLDRLEASGMNTVSVTDYAHQGDWDSANLWFDGDIEGVVREIRAAEQRGLNVVLILRVALDHAFERNKFLWHGMIQPATDAELEEWFRRYGSFVREWARVAEREGVEVLMIGSELNALTNTTPLVEMPALEEYYLNEDKRGEGRQSLLEHASEIEPRQLSVPFQEGYGGLEGYLDDRIATERAWAETTAPTLEEMNRRRRRLLAAWSGLISQVRRIYHGRLGYAANFDQVEQVAFWDQLDVLGINAYFQLRRTLRPRATAQQLYPELVEGWRRVLGDLAALRQARGVPHQPVIFTEMGYTYRRNCTLEPWAADGFSLLPVEPEPGEGPEAGETAGTAEPPRRLVVWQEQPVDSQERALAVRALWQAHRELPEPMLGGILYWKLSTVASHRDIEPFVLLISEDENDPLLNELRRFTR
jgi:hypothetical protein